MSVLSEQVAELRGKALIFEGYQGGEISRMLREAADTIEALGAKLQGETCRYIPDVMHTYYDEDDVEHDADEADPDGCLCSCDKCGNPMLTGEIGWFDESTGEHGGIVYIPRFSFCPECGRKVEK